METTTQTTDLDNKAKTAGIVSYLSLIGWLISYFALYKDAKTSLSAYQIRQTLLLYIVAIVISVAFTIILRVTLSVTLAYVYYVIEFILFVLWLIGFIGAIQGQKKPIPLIGEKAQTMFPNL